MTQAIVGRIGDDMAKAKTTTPDPVALALIPGYIVQSAIGGRLDPYKVEYLSPELARLYDMPRFMADVMDCGPHRVCSSIWH